MSSKNKSFFWASYADLMTSLFFVMLTLFILAIVALNNEFGEAIERTRELEAKIKKADEIANATKDLDKEYFQYYPEYKKHKLNVSVNFPKNVPSMDSIPENVRRELIASGKSLQKFITQTTKENPEIQYLLIIEGQASRDSYVNNYQLSYERALSLKKFWDENGISFNDENCEVLICGSGDGKLSGTGLMRETKESLNQRFLIHILPKPGTIGIQ